MTPTDKRLTYESNVTPEERMKTQEEMTRLAAEASTAPAAADMEAARRLMKRALPASCNCDVPAAEPGKHAEHCRYRAIRAAADLVDSLASQLAAVQRERDRLHARLVGGLEHGDAIHRRWLREALTAILADKEPPPPYGAGRAEAAEAERDVAKQHLATARAALILAARRFRFYEEHHRGKGTQEGRTKAENNHEYAEMCEKAASAAPAPKERPEILPHQRISCPYCKTEVAELIVHWKPLAPAPAQQEKPNGT